MGVELRRGDGGVIAVEVVGEPVATPVLFCHGLADSRLAAHGLAGAAGELGLRLIAPDRPGIGGTDARRVDRVVDWVAEATLVLDALGVGSVALLGTSGGGAFAAACAAEMPHRVRTPRRLPQARRPPPVTNEPPQAETELRQRRLAGYACAATGRHTNGPDAHGGGNRRGLHDPRHHDPAAGDPDRRQLGDRGAPKAMQQHAISDVLMTADGKLRAGHEFSRRLAEGRPSPANSPANGETSCTPTPRDHEPLPPEPGPPPMPDPAPFPQPPPPPTPPTPPQPPRDATRTMTDRPGRAFTNCASDDRWRAWRHRGRQPHKR